MDIGILGGGLSGVTVGSLLKKHNVEILEKEAKIGGLCRSITEKGFTFDIGGGHIIFTRNKDILDFMLDSLGYKVAVNKRNARVLYKGKFITYPFENGLSELEPQENFECLNEFIKMLIDKAQKKLKQPKNMKEWFYYNFGKGIAEKYLVPYSEKIWKIKTEKMGLSWVKKDRLPQPAPEEIIKSSLGISKEGYAVQSKFYYPTSGGIESLVRGIAARLRGKTTTGFEVKKIWREGKKWVVSDGMREKRYDRIVSTLPLPDIVNYLPKVPAKVKGYAKKLRFNSLIEVLIGLKDAGEENKHWLYIPQPDIKTHRVIFISKYSPTMAPEGKKGIMAEITCAPGGEFWKKTDREIIELITSQLDSLGLAKKSDIIFSRVERFKYAYVVNDFNYDFCSQQVKKYLESIGIIICGRFSEWKYLNMDATVQSAMETAKKIK